MHPIDIIVGKNLRVFRSSRGKSQDELGSAVGVSFQQIQKYERGSSVAITAAGRPDDPKTFQMVCHTKGGKQ